MPSAPADRRSLAIVRPSAAGRVRSSPVPPATMMRAASMPVRSDTWAFQASAATGASYDSRRSPAGPGATTWSGRGRLTPPLAASAASRSSPISRSSTRASDAVPAATEAVTPA